MNYTPLMAAAAAGNVPLVEALLDRGADPEACDHLGRNTLHLAMREAFRDAQFRPRAVRRTIRARRPGIHRSEGRGAAGPSRPALERILRISNPVGAVQTNVLAFQDSSSRLRSTPRPYSRRGARCRRASSAPSATNAATCRRYCRATRSSAITPIIAGCSDASRTGGIRSTRTWRSAGAVLKASHGSPCWRRSIWRWFTSSPTRSNGTSAAICGGRPAAPNCQHRSLPKPGKLASRRRSQRRERPLRQRPHDAWPRKRSVAASRSYASVPHHSRRLGAHRKQSARRERSCSAESRLNAQRRQLIRTIRDEVVIFR